MSKKEGSKFYQTEEFKELNRLWLSRLKKTGFQDIENPNGSLKAKNNRTQGYQQQETLMRISIPPFLLILKILGSIFVLLKKEF